MKRMYVVFLGIISMALFSLIAQDKNAGFIKVGKNLYETRGTIVFKKGDKEKFASLLAQEYDVKSFKDEVKVVWDKSKKMGAVKPAFAMANRKIDNNMFQYQLMYDGEQDDVCQRCVNCGDGCDGRKSTLDLKALLNTYEISQR